jgi:hypothetical protein
MFLNVSVIVTDWDFDWKHGDSKEKDGCARRCNECQAVSDCTKGDY